MSAFALDRQASSFAQINVTPLVDVMLVLLIIFMIATPLLTHKLTLNFSSGCHAECPTPDEPVNLSIKQTGELYWNGVALNRAELSQNLAAVARQSDPPLLNLRADAHARYELVADVLAQAKNADLRRITIVSTPY
ncbi:MAG: biopolymer transporter ExbD [Rudaea sp.]